MRMRILTILGIGFLAAAAQATSIVTIDGGTSAVSLTPGASKSITIGIVPDASLVSGYNLIFEISDTSSISLVSCAAQPGVQSSCAAGGVNFSFGAALGQDASAAFTVASFTVNVSAGAAPGATITLLGTSTITDTNLTDNFVGPTTIAQVVAVPEPATASLLGLGLGGLALLGRKRSSRS